MSPRSLDAILLVLVLAACTPTTLSTGPSPGHLQADSVARSPGAIPQPVQQSVSLPRPRATARTETYSVVVNNVKVHDLLFALARDAKINVDIHPGITGAVTLNAIDQTLPQLLTRIAKQVDMRFEMDGPNLVVMPDSPYVKTYKVDYVNMARSVVGTVSTNTQISTSSLGTSGGGSSAGENTSRIQIVNTSANLFWSRLEHNVWALLTEKDKMITKVKCSTREEAMMTEDSQASASVEGSAAGSAAGSREYSIGQDSGEVKAAVKGSASGSGKAAAERKGKRERDDHCEHLREAPVVTSNPETGVLSVRATRRQHERVQEFLDRVMNNARRQVLIEATIIEVTLSDGYQQGIEWSRVTSGTEYSVTKPTLTTNVPSAVTPFVIKYRDINPLNLLATVELLRAFGTVKVLSSPKLAVLNNQTATLKVSEDFVYFKVETSSVPGGPNTNATVATTTTPQSVSIGFFMSLTAQISDTGTVTMNVRPSISSIAELKQDPNPELARLNIKNLVPQIRMREIESMMRVESGDIAVLGGLMEDRLDNRLGRLPLLGDIPFVGEVFNNRNNSSGKSELVVLLRPTVIKDASIEGDFSSFRDSLPDREFFRTDQVYRPFSLPERPAEPLR
ncbi:MAG TPA: pilus (MSHA type) biogenesis protein MshL [Candidatus Accumulibacter phosphatis]|nr:pilus (MSHA type) biogenesis protein MshL [Candidatus Accumulibacter phosphatis]